MSMASFVVLGLLVTINKTESNSSDVLAEPSVPISSMP